MTEKKMPGPEAFGWEDWPHKTGYRQKKEPRGAGEGTRTDDDFEKWRREYSEFRDLIFWLALLLGLGFIWMLAGSWFGWMTGIF